MIDRVQEVADELIGTAKSLHDAATQDEISDSQFIDGLHQLAFECDCCGWWASTDELHNDPIQTQDELCDECVASEG